jgi:rhodanese-related sulfurtransferase
MVEHKVLLINVLSRDLFDDCHIQGSINVPLEQLEQFAQQLDVNQKIVVYCASYACRVSLKAWRLLDGMGFQNLWAYEGGMADWYHKGLPFVGLCQAPYLMGKIERPSGEAKDVKQIYADELIFLLQENGVLTDKK